MISQHPKIAAHPVLSKAYIHFLKYHQSQLLINTLNQGTYIWNFKENSIFKLDINDKLVINNVLELENEWWLGTNSGIKKFDISNHQISEFHDLDQVIQVMDMCKIGDSIWLSTKDHGLWNVNESVGSVQKPIQYTNPESYRSNLLHRMVWSKTQNKIWLNTGYGISSFDILNHRFVNYTIKDGIGFTRRNGSVFH